MLGTIDHVGYLARDLEQGIADFRRRLGVEVVRRFERPQFSLLGAYLGSGSGELELFVFSDPALQAERLAGRELVLDHIAFSVPDIAALQARLAAESVRFSGPDLRGELTEPVDLGGALHLWTVPETCGGQALQLIQPPAQRAVER
jgi:catechol 2,3-dioxygenase-like lactoylglutathione lyase family enzyme